MSEGECEEGGGGGEGVREGRSERGGDGGGLMNGWNQGRWG